MALKLSVAVITKKSEIISGIFLQLLFKDWRMKVDKLNEAVLASKCKCRLFTPKEFLVGIGIIIGAAEFAKRGSDLFAVKDQAGEEEDDEVWASLCHELHFEQYMAFSRWKDFRRFFPEVFADAEKKALIHGINFRQQLTNLTTFTKRNYVVRYGSPLMRVCVPGSLERLLLEGILTYPLLLLKLRTKLKLISKPF
jgi:hypothetical protein